MKNRARPVSGIWAQSARATVVFLVISVSAHAQGSPPPPVIEGLLPNGDYVLDIDGQNAPLAAFYLAESVPALVLVTPEIPAAVLLLPGSGSVQTVPSAGMATQPDGSLRLVTDSAKAQGGFQVLASWIVFSVDGKQFTLKERPWLLGPQAVAVLEGHNPEYVWRSKAYSPNSDAVAELQKHPVDVQLRVFFGSWCAYCKQNVPRLMKVATALSSSHIHIEFYGLPRNFGKHPVAGPLKITSVPTGVVIVNGKELGRITGIQWAAPEVALRDILRQ